MNQNIRLVGILGPESSGKTTLCNTLSKFYSTEMADEYARKYLTNFNKKINLKDMEIMYKRHVEQINSKLSNSKTFLFVDTECYNFLLWYEWGFEKTPLSFLKMVSQNPINIYLLLYPDLKWEYDPLREFRDKKTRLKLFYSYLECIKSENKTYTIIKGNNRAEQAIHFINSLI